MDLSDILFLMVLGFSLAAPIGPVNAEMIKQVLKPNGGLFFGVFTGLGAMTGDLLIASSVLFIGTEFLESLLDAKAIFMTLVLLNVALLSYIGITTLLSKPDISLDKYKRVEEEAVTGTDILIPTKSSFRLSMRMVTGFVFVTTSPWSYLWWVSFGPTILKSGIALATFGQRFIVTLYFLAGIFVWVILFCAILSYSSKFASERILKTIIDASAILMLLLALKILNDAVCLVFNFGLCGISWL